VIFKRICKVQLNKKRIGSTERFVRESNITKKQRYRMNSQCCAAGVSDGGWSVKRPTLHINEHRTKINE